MSIDDYYRRQAAKIEAELGWALTTQNEQALRAASEDLVRLSVEYAGHHGATQAGRRLEDFLKSDAYSGMDPQAKAKQAEDDLERVSETYRRKCL